MKCYNTTTCMVFGLLGLVLASGCGSEPLPPEPPTISVTITPDTVSLLTGATQDFSATVTNDQGGKGVTWSINGCTGDTLTCGNLTNVTHTSVTYRASATVPPGGLGVTATSVADNTKSSTASVTVTAAALLVAVTPSTVNLQTGGSRDFSATVTNDPAAKGVTWSITGCAGDAATCGSLTNITYASVTYTAPATVPPGGLGVTATSVADNTKSSTASVTVTATGSVSVTVSPESAKVVVGGTVGLRTQVVDQLGATLLNQTIAWSSDNATVATVRVSYTHCRWSCPSPPRPTGGAVVTGVSEGTARIVVSFQGKSDTSFITVVPDTIVGFAISPSLDTLLIRGTVQLTGISNGKVGGQRPVPADRVTWSSLDPGIAAVNDAGLVTALAPGQTTITGTWNGFSAMSQIAVIVDVVAGGTLMVGLEYPTGLWIKDGRVYLTETAGRNTSFGGKIDLLRYDVTTQQTQVLLNHPANSDAVVVTGDETIYLTSYHGSIPGDSGDVSIAQFDSGQQLWVETHLLTLAIASTDMFLDANGDIYVIGLGATSNAASLYRLTPPDYATAPSVVARGLGRSFSLTKIGSDVYYSEIGTREVRRLMGGSDTSFVTGVTVGSLTSDGTFLFMSDFLTGQILRKNLTTGALETIATGLRNPTALRYDPQSGNLYFLEGGTPGAQYKNGRLGVIANLH